MLLSEREQAAPRLTEADSSRPAWLLPGSYEWLLPRVMPGPRYKVVENASAIP